MKKDQFLKSFLIQLFKDALKVQCQTYWKRQSHLDSSHRKLSTILTKAAQATKCPTKNFSNQLYANSKSSETKTLIYTVFNTYQSMVSNASTNSYISMISRRTDRMMNRRLYWSQIARYRKARIHSGQISGQVKRVSMKK